MNAAAASARPHRYRRLRRFGALVLVLACLYLALPWLLPALANFLDVSEPPHQVDAVLILGGGNETRPFVAAALVNAGLAREALIPTVRLSPAVEAGLWPSDHEVMRRVLIARGVPAEAVTLLPGEATSTRDEAQMLGRFLDAHPDYRVAVVTTTYHTRRARAICRRQLGARARQIVFFAAPTEYYDAANWWRCRAGVSAYLTEYIKLGIEKLSRQDRAGEGMSRLSIPPIAGRGADHVPQLRTVSNVSTRISDC